MITIKEFADGTKYFRSCINFEQSYLDSKAIQFMNEMPNKIMFCIQQRDDLLRILKQYIDNEKCRFDHHGLCQEHGLTKPCRNQIAKDLIAKVETK